MPRYAHYQLKWSSQTQTYELHIGDLASEHTLTADWLEKIASFSFQSRSGEHYTVRKQRVQRGSTYWYGYRHVHGRIVKRYLGKTSDLSITRLEEGAHFLESEARSPQHSSRSSKETTIAQSAPLTPHSLYVEPASSASLLPLLSSKLSPPRLSVSLVERSHLLARLDTSLLHTLTLVQAPAGFGKTTLVAQWINERRAHPPFPAVAWISLEASDTDPLRFWRSVITACQTLQNNVGQAALAQLSAATQPPFQAPPLNTVLTHFLNDLTQQVPDGLLVLDDYHAIEEPRIHETLAFFLDHLPTTLHVLLLSRSEPPLPLLRWRAKGNLYELHRADLRFSLEETATFLRQALPVPLSDTVLIQLDTSLEGWAAGLRLLTFALQGPRTVQEVEHVLLSLGNGSGPSHAHQPLLDYFMTEILQAQPEPLQRFLLQTSVLGRLSDSLCDAVTNSENSPALLEAIEQAGLFLEALDRGEEGPWYRFHALFAEAMRREAARRLSKEEQQVLSLRASLWYEQHAMTEEAIEAALLANDMERAALLIEQADANEQQYELQTLRHWLSPIPEEVLRTHPMLCWLAALSLRFQEEEAISEVARGHIEALLQMAEEGWRRQNELPLIGLISAFHAMSDWRTGQFSHAVEHAQHALTVLPNDKQDHRIQMFRGVCLFIIGTGHMYEGRFDKARLSFLEAHACSQVDGDRHLTLSLILLLGVCSYALDELRQAHEYYQLALSDARRQKDREIIAQALLGLASISFEWNELAAAEHHASEALALVSQEEQDLRDRAAFQLALLSHTRGQITSAQQQLVALLARLQVTSTPQAIQMIPDVLICQARLYMEDGDIQGALHNLEMLDLEEHMEAKIFQGRLLLAQGKPHEALRQLERLLPSAQEWRLTRKTLEIQVLLALAHAACQQEQQARQWLQQALPQARHEGFVRLFLSEGERLARLLRQLIPTLGEPALRSYAQSILRAFVITNGESTLGATSSGGVLFEPLSPQEQRVLQLLVTGRTNLEIAQELVVSVNTVKDHVKHLYRKLGVSNRLQASEAAHHLKLV